MLSLWLSFYIWHAFELSTSGWYMLPYMMTSMVIAGCDLVVTSVFAVKFLSRVSD